MIQEALPLLLTGETEDLIQGPARSFAGGQVEFDVVLVGVQPHVQQERFQLHVAPRMSYPESLDPASIRRASQNFHAFASRERYATLQAAKRRKNAAHSASCGWRRKNDPAPKGRKKR